MPTTTRWRRASSPRSSASFSIDEGSRRKPKRAWPCSSSSRASTIRADATPRSAISLPSTTSDATSSKRSIPAHTSLPSCSGPSRCGLEKSPQVSTSAQRPILTAPARAGAPDVRAGTEERAPQGPNQGTGPNRRTQCRQIRYLERKSSPLHQTGASPDHNTPWLLARPKPPLVDIFICTYNEEEAILERTIVGALAL